MSGVKNLVEQQNNILQQIKTQNKETKGKTNRNSTNDLNLNLKPMHSLESQNKSNIEIDKSESSVSCNTHSSSSVDVRQGITRNSSSSMQTLRRILEIEEMKQFSENIRVKA